jgi:hypothetical protein
MNAACAVLGKTTEEAFWTIYEHWWEYPVGKGDAPQNFEKVSIFG